MLVYKCVRQGQTFFLKVAPAALQTPAQVLGTFAFARHLSNGGVPRPTAVPSESGALTETVELAGRQYTLWAVGEVPGIPMDWREWTPGLFRRWGALLGKMHALAQRYQPPPGTTRPTWHDEWALDYDCIPTRHARIRQQADALYQRLTVLPKTSNGFGLCHGDLHQENFFLDGHILRPFDFDNCLYDWFAADFAPILHNALLAQAHYYERGEHAYWAGGQPMSSPQFTAYFLRHFWDGYRSEHLLDPSWLRCLPDFFLRRHLSVGVWRIESGSPAADRWPWRGAVQFTAELEDPAWIGALFEPALRELVEGVF